MKRRQLLLASAGLAAAQRALAQPAPATITRDGARPQFSHGVQSGDPVPGRALVWTRSDRPARMWLEWSTTASFSNASRVRGPWLLEDTDFTGRLDLSQLPDGQEIFYRVLLQDLGNERAFSEPLAGHLRLPSVRQPRHIRFVWSGDTAGQGFGINESWGGMKIYEQMRRQNPDFFLHSGDTIYADGPIAREMSLPDGSVWTNVVTEEVSKVAETLNEFRGRYRYNLMDANVRRLSAEVPQIWQWDDHEVTNNWSDSKSLANDARYTEKNVPLLIARGTRAFLEYAPMRPFDVRESQRVYRKFSHGPLLEMFVIDMRSYRGPNTANVQSTPGPETAFLGREQLDWLKSGLEDSKAVWKVVAADMPIGLNVGDGSLPGGIPRWEAIANGNHGGPLGRELEIAELLSFLKRQKVRNVVWLTGDVHYCAAHYYDPGKAAFPDFDGFWEFVSGPLNAGSFGPNTLDGTFGPQVVFFKAPPPGSSNLSPYAGLQFFGEVNLDAQSHEMTVDLRDINGVSVFSRTLQPRNG